jgi:hypothetical protein
VGRIFASLLHMPAGAGRVYYLVLGDSIKRNMEALDLVDPDHIISLDHPYIFNRKAARRGPVRAVKTVGIKNFAAGFDTDAWIARLAATHPGLTFSIIGTRTSIGGPNIENHTTTTQKSRAEYESILSRMDAMIFLYPDVEYRLKASGAIFDCIELGIPTIAVRNDYFEHLFRLHGPLGYLYADPDAIDANLDRALADDHTDIRHNIAAARARHSPENLTRVLRKKLDALPVA